MGQPVQTLADLGEVPPSVTHARTIRSAGAAVPGAVGFSAPEPGSADLRAIDPRTVGPQATDPRTIAPVPAGTEQRTAELLVDSGHPFFFDHPLDHVPAALLIAGLLELAGPMADQASAAERRRLRLSLKVPNMAELGVPVTLDLRACPGRPGATWAVHATQQGGTIADGELSVVPESADAPPARSAVDCVDGAEAPLVHRVRSENVVLGHGRMADGKWLAAPLRLPSADHYLTLRRRVTGSVETLLEAGRQFGTLYCHVAAQRREAQILLLGVTADIPLLLPPLPLVTLRSRLDPGHRSRGRLAIEYLGGGADGDSIGELAVDYLAVSPAAYRRLRGQQAAS